MNAPIGVGEIVLDPDVRSVRETGLAAQLAAMTWEPLPMSTNYQPDPQHVGRVTIDTSGELRIEHTRRTR